MKNTNYWKTLLGVVATCTAIVGMTSVGMTSAAWAGAISINLAADVQPGTDVGANIAGVVPVGNWNDVLLAQQTNRPLIDDSGVTVPGLTLSTLETFAFTPSAFDAGANSNFANPGDTAMMRGHIYHGAGPLNVDLVFTGTVPYANFDLYVYFNSGGLGDNSQNYELLDSSGGSLGLVSANAHEVAAVDTSYVEADSSGTDNANYVVFSGLTSADVPTDFILRATASTIPAAQGFKYFNGVQIVGVVPEPTSLTLLLAGAFGLLLRVRRSRKR